MPTDWFSWFVLFHGIVCLLNYSYSFSILCAYVIVQQYRVILIAFLAHDGGADLALALRRAPSLLR